MPQFHLSVGSDPTPPLLVGDLVEMPKFRTKESKLGVMRQWTRECPYMDKAQLAEFLGMGLLPPVYLFLAGKLKE